VPLVAAGIITPAAPVVPPAAALPGALVPAAFVPAAVLRAPAAAFVPATAVPTIPLLPALIAIAPAVATGSPATGVTAATVLPLSSPPQAALEIIVASAIDFVIDLIIVLHAIDECAVRSMNVCLQRSTQR
jgi:hypothetical protein